MAEEVVLARLSIDSSGVVSGQRETGVALNAGGSQLETFSRRVNRSAGASDLFVKRLFNMRLAVAALLGGFTIAGIALQIANLTKELITGTEAWKVFSGAMTDVFNALVKGETAAQRSRRHVSELLKEFQITSPLLTAANRLDQVSAAMDKLARSSANAQDVMAGVMAALDEQSKTMQELIRNAGESLGLSAEQLKQFISGAQFAFTGEGFQVVPPALPPTPAPEFQKLQRRRGFVEAKPFTEFDTEAEFEERLSLGIPTDEDLARIDALNLLMQDSGTLSKDWLDESVLLVDAQRRLGDAVFDLTEITPESIAALEGQIKATAKAEAAYMLLGAAAAQTGAVIGEALFGADQNFKQAIAGILKSIAIMSLSMAIFSLAMAALSSTGIGMAVTGGTAAQFKAAAGLFFKVAAFTGAAAVALGSRSQEGAGGGGTTTALGFAPAAGAPRASPNVTVIVEGSVVTERELIDIVRDAISDGLDFEPSAAA